MDRAIRPSTVRNFHLPLPADLYESLREEASRLGRPATSVAREAIEEWLRHRRKLAVREEIASYAASAAGTPADLDRGLERATLETLRKKGTKR